MEREDRMLQDAHKPTSRVMHRRPIAAASPLHRRKTAAQSPQSRRSIAAKPPLDFGGQWVYLTNCCSKGLFLKGKARPEDSIERINVAA